MGTQGRKGEVMKREELKKEYPNGKMDGAYYYVAEADSVMDALEARIKELQEENIAKDMAGAELHNENKALRFNLDDWKHKAEEMELTAKSFDAEIGRSHERIKELELTLEFSNWSAHDNIRILNEQIKQRDERIKDTESKYNQLCWQHDALTDECNKADERIQKLNNENADFVMESEKLQERIKELEKKLEDANGYAQTLELARDKAQQENKELSYHIEFVLKKRINELEFAGKSFVAEIALSHERIKELEEVISKMETTEESSAVEEG